MPGWVAIAHGGAGATGFAILLYVFAHNPGFAPARYGVIVLTGAIGLGCVNVVYHLRRIRHRSTLIVIHALTAVAGVGTLAYGVLVGATPRQPPAPSTQPEVPMPIASSSVAPAPVEAPKEIKATEISLEPITFAGNSVALTEGALTAIARMADAITARKVEHIEIQGHTDERGSEALNLTLARARANAVLEALVARGIDRSWLQARAFGARCPALPACRQPQRPESCHQESSWSQDRRVELVVIEPGQPPQDACDRHSKVTARVSAVP